MAAPRNRRHILVADAPQTEAFTTRRSGRTKAFQRPANRVEQAHQLTVALNRAVEQVPVGERQEAQAERGRTGSLVAFRAPPGVELNLKLLENKRAGIEVRDVIRSAGQDEQAFVETATVFIPQEAVVHFLNKFEQYATEETRRGHPKNRDLVGCRKSANRNPIAENRLQPMPSSLAGCLMHCTSSLLPPVG